MQRGIGGFYIIRILRALKPLRMIENYPGVRHIVDTILLSAPRMLNVIFLLLFFWFLFGKHHLALIFLTIFATRFW
jgi:hypothetical protein